MNKKERVRIVEAGRMDLLEKSDLIKAIREVKTGYVSEVMEAYAALKTPAGPQVLNSNEVISALKKYSRNPVESFYVITLRTDKTIIRTVEINKGLLSKTFVSVPEIFRAAIIDHASSIIIAHNHPSGCLEPSGPDKTTTKTMIQAGKLLNIPVLDHVIFSKNGFYSFFEHGAFN